MNSQAKEVKKSEGKADEDDADKNLEGKAQEENPKKKRDCILGSRRRIYKSSMRDLSYHCN